jgi:hypothetical protein
MTGKKKGQDLCELWKSCHAWTKHVKIGRDLLRREFEAANKIGDLTFAAYSRLDLNTNLLAAGDPLVEVQRETEHGLEFAHKMRFGLVIDRIA